MKWFLVVSAVVLCASALPTQVVFDDDFDWASEEELLATNATSDPRAARNVGFGASTRGGAGGATWTVWDAWALRDAILTNNARIVSVRGHIDLSVLFVGSPGVVLDVGSWKTIVGGDSNAVIFGGGLRIKDNQHVIIQNIKFHNALSYAPGERPNGAGGILSQVAGEYTEVDAVLCETATYVWIDHCEFADDPWIANNIANDRMRHDGLVDIKRASNWITLTYNIFRNHNKVMLIGHSDGNAAQDVGRLKTSLIKNWFMGVRQRNPRVRYGEIHMLNNLYTDIGSYGIGVGAGASIYAERNSFINSRAWRHPDGTPNPMGNLLHFNNIFVNSNWDAVPSAVHWLPSQHYSYTPIAAQSVEADVRRNAGTW